jgi:hypothetical protein
MGEDKVSLKKIAKIIGPYLFAKPLIEILDRYVKGFSLSYPKFFILYSCVLVVLLCVRIFKDKRSRTRIIDAWRDDWWAALNKAFWILAYWTRYTLIRAHVLLILMVTSLVGLCVSEIYLLLDSHVIHTKFTAFSYMMGGILIALCYTVWTIILKDRTQPIDDIRTAFRREWLQAMPTKVIPVNEHDVDGIITDAIMASRGEVRIMAIHARFFLGTPSKVKQYLSQDSSNTIRALILDPLQINVRRRARRVVGEIAQEYIGSFYDIAANIAQLKDARIQVKVLTERPSYRLFIMPTLALLQYYGPNTHGSDSDLYVVRNEMCREICDVYDSVIAPNVPSGRHVTSCFYDYVVDLFENRWTRRNCLPLVTLDDEDDSRLAQIYNLLNRFSFKMQRPIGHWNFVSCISDKLFDSTTHPFPATWDGDKIRIRQILSDYATSVGANSAWTPPDTMKVTCDSPKYDIEVILKQKGSKVRGQFKAVGQTSRRAAKRLQRIVDDKLR